MNSEFKLALATYRSTSEHQEPFEGPLFPCLLQAKVLQTAPRMQQTKLWGKHAGDVLQMVSPHVPGV